MPRTTTDIQPTVDQRDLAEKALVADHGYQRRLFRAADPGSDPSHRERSPEMSTPTLTPTADPDDSRKWEIELDPRLRDLSDLPRIPAQRSRSADKRTADAEIVEGYDEWLRTERSN